MSFAPLFDPTNQFITRAGTPLFGGRLYVYLNGTENLATVKNIAGTTIQQPIATDSNGRATGGAFVDDGSLYRLEVRDPYDALLWCIEGMSPLVGGGGSPAPAGDELWGHWTNDNGWESVGSSYTPFSQYKFAEGAIDGNVIGTEGPIHLKGGLYDFKAEVGFTSGGGGGYQRYDVKLVYGSTTLRAMSFLFYDMSSTDIMTEWFCGVFRLESEGDVEFQIKRITGTTSRAMKISHFFVHSIQ